MLAVVAVLVAVWSLVNRCFYGFRKHLKFSLTSENKNIYVQNTHQTCTLLCFRSLDIIKDTVVEIIVCLNERHSDVFLELKKKVVYIGII
jgi:hypothetical protein